jgi:hypothetical protein
LTGSDLDSVRGAVLVRHGEGGKRHEVRMDRWAWERLAAWLTLRATIPVGWWSSANSDTPISPRLQAASARVAKQRLTAALAGDSVSRSSIRTVA